MSSQKKLTPQEYYTTKYPFFFVSLTETSLPIPIRRFEEQNLILDAHPLLEAKDQLSGFIVAKNDLGILSFALERIQEEQDKDKFDVFRFAIVPNSVKLINRREYYRLESLSKVDCLITDEDNQTQTCQLIDLSAGGVRIQTDQPLTTNQTYFFKTELSAEEPLPIETLIYIIHQNHLATSQEYGAKFVRTLHKNTYPILTKDVHSKIIQYINRSLVERSKIL